MIQVGDVHVFSRSVENQPAMFLLLTVVERIHKANLDGTEVSIYKALGQHKDEFFIERIIRYEGYGDSLAIHTFTQAKPNPPDHYSSGAYPQWRDVTEFKDVPLEPLIVKQYPELLGYCPVHQQVLYYRNYIHSGCIEETKEQTAWRGWF